MRPLNSRLVHPKKSVEIPPGSIVRILEAGGAGFGAPGEREIEKVMEDVRNGLVSHAGALEDYGVEVKGGKGTRR